MRRHGVIGRLSVIIGLGSLALLVVLHGWTVHSRLMAASQTFVASVGDRLVAIDRLITEHGLAEPALTAAFGAPGFEIELRADRPAAATREWNHADELRATFSHDAGSSVARRFVLQFPIERSGPPSPRVLMALERQDGRWLVASATSAALRSGWLTAVWSWNLALVAGVIVVMLWLTRRALHHLPAFAAAAEALGNDTEAPPLPQQRGPKEVRQLAIAFNAMQHRIRNHLHERTAMLAAVSHDLRTFLTRLELRTEYIDDAEQRERARADIADMSALLDGVLELAREERTPASREPLDLASLLQSLVTDAEDLGQPVSYDGPPRLAVEGRALALKRAFGNLIENAVRYGERADVRLDVEPDRARVVIADRGPGIPNAERARVLEPFERLEGSRSRTTGGTGLGLAICQAVVKRHGGTLAFADRAGGGLEVIVELPLAVVPL